MSSENLQGKAHSCLEKDSAYISTRGDETPAPNSLGFAPGTWPETFQEIQRLIDAFRAKQAAQDAYIELLEGLLR